MLCPNCHSSGMEVIEKEGLSPLFNVYGCTLHTPLRQLAGNPFMSLAVQYEPECKAEYYTRKCFRCDGKGVIQ